MKKKYGWIFAVKGRPGVYSSGWGRSISSIPSTTKLSQAVVVFTRREARNVKSYGETIFRVKLTRSGKAKKIIGRG